MWDFFAQKVSSKQRWAMLTPTKLVDEKDKLVEPAKDDKERAKSKHGLLSSLTRGFTGREKDKPDKEKDKEARTERSESTSRVQFFSLKNSSPGNSSAVSGDSPFNKRKSQKFGSAQTIPKLKDRDTDEEAAFSSSTVELIPMNPTGNDNTRAEALAGKSEREVIMIEFLESEEGYIKNLKKIFDNWHVPMEESLSGKKPIATKEQISELFGQLQPVYMLHEKVIWGLLKEGDLENFGKKFVDIIDMFKLYVHFVNHYENYIKIYSDLLEKSRFKTFEKEAATKAGVSSLVDILITPIQRLPRYQLFLERLVKATPPDHPDFEKLKESVEKMVKQNNIINQKKSDHESRFKLIQVQKTIGKRFVCTNGGSANLITPNRRWIFDGILSHNHPSKEWIDVHLYLMSDVMLLCEMTEKKEVLMKTWDNLKTITIQQAVDTDFAISQQGGTGSVSLSCNTEQERSDWIKKIKDAIEAAPESENQQISKSAGNSNSALMHESSEDSEVEEENDDDGSASQSQSRSSSVLTSSNPDSSSQRSSLKLGSKSNSQLELPEIPDTPNQEPSTLFSTSSQDSSSSANSNITLYFRGDTGTPPSSRPSSLPSSLPSSASSSSNSSPKIAKKTAEEIVPDAPAITSSVSTAPGDSDIVFPSLPVAPVPVPNFDPPSTRKSLPRPPPKTKPLPNPRSDSLSDTAKLREHIRELEAKNLVLVAKLREHNIPFVDADHEGKFFVKALVTFEDKNYKENFNVSTKEELFHAVKARFELEPSKDQNNSQSSVQSNNPSSSENNSGAPSGNYILEYFDKDFKEFVVVQRLTELPPMVHLRIRKHQDHQQQ